jgi:hypothetical protein
VTRRNNRQRGKARKAANRDYRHELLTRSVQPRRRWHGKVVLKFGRDADAQWHIVFSNVRFPVDTATADPMDGLPELTNLARFGSPDIN